MSNRFQHGVRRLRLTLALVTLGVALSACDGGDAVSDAVDLTDAERAYLDGVVAALRLFDARNEEFQHALGQTYQSNEALFGALARAGAGTAFEPGLDALERLQPPPRFADDHRILLDRQRSLVRIDRDIGVALENADLVRFVLLNMRLLLTGDRAALDLETGVCETLLRERFADQATQSAAYLASVYCERGEPPGGNYGEQVREILRGMTIEVADRAPALAFFGLLPVVQDEAFLEVANEAFSEIVVVTEAASRKIHALRPPERMAGDHERLLAYLNQVEAIMDELVEAALTGDVDAFEVNDFPMLYCQTRDEIGLAYRPIVRVHFADAFGFCPGTGEF